MWKQACLTISLMSVLCFHFQHLHKNNCMFKYIFRSAVSCICLSLFLPSRVVVKCAEVSLTQHFLSFSSANELKRSRVLKCDGKLLLKVQRVSICCASQKLLNQRRLDVGRSWVFEMLNSLRLTRFSFSIHLILFSETCWIWIFYKSIRFRKGVTTNLKGKFHEAQSGLFRCLKISCLSTGKNGKQK